ncbi:MAG TPA: DUF6036 family nucleotidyltransferase [Steroidobacteraceae bacterium]|nr:DUF6036 family nucleotidyltransferase [Steroidobacteraceae bacterium]
MKKREVDHVLRAAGRITGEKQFIIVGSQALHGKYPDLADQIIKSVEVDLLATKAPGRTEWLSSIGAYSPFHESFGYYADPVDDKTATLPKGWKNRLVNLPAGETEGVKGLCLEPHDLAIAKYAASREKDLIFTRELVQRGLLSKDRLFSLLDQTSVDDAARERIRGQIERDFSAERKHVADVTLQPSPKARTTAAASNAAKELAAIRARAREEWLEERQKARDGLQRDDLSGSDREKTPQPGVAPDIDDK